MKAAAVLLGPTGVGLIGLYTNLMQTATTVSALGLGTVGTRQIAAANAGNGETTVGQARRSLFWAALVLSFIGALLFWLTSGWIGRIVTGEDTRSAEIAWLSIGVGLSVASASQAALLTGLRRIGDLARINAGSGVVSAALGVTSLWLWGSNGLLAMILVAPATTFFLGHLYVTRLGRPAGQRERLPEMAQRWRELVTLGIPFMLSSLVTIFGHLSVRTLVQNELGLEALGHFQASWMIGATYLGFVLGAMGTDFYPRLTASIDDSVAAARLINQQTEVALLLCSPLLFVMFGSTPFVIFLLYSTDFYASIEILRWQILGDILKMMSWPLGIFLIASGAGKTFIFAETLGTSVFVLSVFVGLPLIGLTATGLAFVALYSVYLPTMWILIRRRINFQWTRAVKAQVAIIVAGILIIGAFTLWSDTAGALAGLGLGALFGISSLIRLSEVSGATGRLETFVKMSKQLRQKLRL